jgi:hypothetical protein
MTGIADAWIREHELSLAALLQAIPPVRGLPGPVAVPVAAPVVQPRLLLPWSGDTVPILPHPSMSGVFVLVTPTAGPPPVLSSAPAVVEPALVKAKTFDVSTPSFFNMTSAQRHDVLIKSGTVWKKHRLLLDRWSDTDWISVESLLNFDLSLAAFGGATMFKHIASQVGSTNKLIFRLFNTVV